MSLVSPPKRRIRRPPKGPDTETPVEKETIRRLRRIESRLVSLMKHEGMTHDGRAPLPEGHHEDIEHAPPKPDHD